VRPWRPRVDPPDGRPGTRLRPLRCSSEGLSGYRREGEWPQKRRAPPRSPQLDPKPKASWRGRGESPDCHEPRVRLDGDRKSSQGASPWIFIHRSPAVHLEYDNLEGPGQALPGMASDGQNRTLYSSVTGAPTPISLARRSVRAARALTGPSLISGQENRVRRGCYCRPPYDQGPKPRPPVACRHA
jgi:hypothetical protein